MRRIILSAADYLRLAVLVALVAELSLLAVAHTREILGMQPLGIDFMPMWAAAREAFNHTSLVYNFAALTRFQHPLLAGFHGLRPFAYPPTALLLFAPFAYAPFAVANALWTGASVLLIVGAMASQLKSRRVLALMLLVLSPASVLVMLTGQTTFLIATLALVGVLNLKSRPILAGVLFGLAAAIKPPVLVLLPVALIATGQWRAFASAAATGIIAAAASVMVFGLQPWFGWLGAMPRFERLIMNSPSLMRGVITPTGLGVSLHLQPDALLLWRFLFALIGVAIAWTVFRRTEDPARRLVALLGGSLFVSPYAMHYDAALLAPAAVLMLTHRSSPLAWVTALIAALLLCCAAIPHWGAAAVTAFVLLVALTREDGVGAVLREAAPALEPPPLPVQEAA